MLEMNLANVKKLFFDRKAVMDAVSRAQRAVFSRIGAFIRQTARSSIRRRKGTSKPGRPPNSHTGLLRDHIFFAYEPERKGVVIGPIRLNTSDGTAPRLLESGGSTTWQEQGKRERVVYLARPYMRPALEKELPRLPALWRNSVHR